MEKLLEMSDMRITVGGVEQPKDAAYVGDEHMKMHTYEQIGRDMRARVGIMSQGTFFHIPGSDESRRKYGVWKYDASWPRDDTLLLIYCLGGGVASYPTVADVDRVCAVMRKEGRPEGRVIDSRFRGLYAYNPTPEETVSQVFVPVRDDLNSVSRMGLLRFPGHGELLRQVPKFFVGEMNLLPPDLMDFPDTRYLYLEGCESPPGEIVHALVTMKRIVKDCCEVHPELKLSIGVMAVGPFNSEVGTDTVTTEGLYLLRQVTDVGDFLSHNFGSSCFFLTPRILLNTDDYCYHLTPDGHVLGGEGVFAARMRMGYAVTNLDAYRRERAVQLRERGMAQDAEQRRAMSFIRLELFNYATRMMRPVTLLDLGIGEGADLHKYMRSSVRYVLGLDINELSLRGAMQRYLGMRGPTYALTLVNSDFRVRPTKPVVHAQMVVLNFTLQFACASSEALSNLITHLTLNVVPGGLVIGVYPDPLNMVAFVRETKLLTFERKQAIFGCASDLDPDSRELTGNFGFGIAYQFKMASWDESVTEYLVPFHRFVDRMYSKGFCLLTSYPVAHGVPKLGIKGCGGVHASLYSAFAFQRLDHVMHAPQPIGQEGVLESHNVGAAGGGGYPIEHYGLRHPHYPACPNLPLSSAVNLRIINCPDQERMGCTHTAFSYP